MGEISHRILKIGGLTIVTVVTVLIFGISYATLCVIIPAASGTVYLSQKEYSHRRIRQAAAVHGRRMRNLGVLERQREWKHSSSSSDRTLHSSSAYNTPTNKLSEGFSQALPRMRRLNTTSSSFSSPLVGSAALSRTIMTAQRRQPLAQYSNMSILPTVHLDRPSRHILSERNSRMVGSAVTVKIAPPDVLKPPTPVLLHVEPKTREQECDPCDTNTVLTAIRETRKRTLRDEEAVSPSTDWTQASKRRRQDQVHTHNGDRPQVPNGDIGMDIGHLQLGAQKRGASPTPESVTEDERVAKRSRRVSGQAEGARQSGETHGARNPIDVSYSSSRRWLDRKARERSASRSRASSVVSSGSHDTGHHMSDGHSYIAGSSGTSTPRRSYGLSDDDDDEEMGSYQRSAADSIVRQTCARLAGHGSGQESVTAGESERDRPGSRRTTPTPRRYDIRPHSTLIDSIVKVPHLRYDLTVEDYAADRQAEMDRVRQMLSDDVDDTGDTDTAGVPVSLHLGVQPTPSTALPVKSLFATSLTSAASTATSALSTATSAAYTVTSALSTATSAASTATSAASTAITAPSTATSQSTAAPFVLPSMGQFATTTTDSGASWVSSAASDPVPATGGTATTSVPGTATNSFGAGLSFTASASVPGASKQSFSASKPFGVTMSAPSSVASSGAASTVPSGVANAMPSGAASAASSGAPPRSPPAYSFKPVFSVPTPPGTDSTQPAGLITRTPTLETMLRSDSPAKAPGGSSGQTTMRPQSLFGGATSSAGGPHTLSHAAAPSVASNTQPLVNGGTDMFKLGTASAPTMSFGAPKDAPAASTNLFGFSAPTLTGTSKAAAPSLATTSAATNSTFQFGAPPASSASMFGAGSAPVVNSVGSAGSMFGQKNATVSAAKTGSGVAKSLFGNTSSQPSMFGSGGATTAPGTGAAFTFGAGKPDSTAPQSVFGIAPVVNGTASNPAFPASQNGGVGANTATFGTATSSAQGGVFQFGGAPKAAATPSFTPVFNFSQGPTQTSQPPPFGGSVNTSQSSASFTTPFKGFGQNSSAFGVDSTTTPTSGVFGTPTSTAPFGGGAGGVGASAFGAATNAKPFGTSSSFGSFGTGQTQPAAAGVVNFGAATAAAAAPNTGFQFGQQNAAAPAPAFGGSSSFAAPSFAAPPPGGNMFSLGAAAPTNRPRAMARTGRRRGPRR